MFVEQYADDGAVVKNHELAFNYSMLLPAFKGVDCVAAVDALCNPRGFVLVDEHQRNPKYTNIYSAGVCIAIPPRNVAWMKKGKWMHYAKIAFEKYFIRKMKKGNSEPVYEKYVLKALGINRLE